MRCVVTLDFHGHTPTDAAIAEEFGRVAAMMAKGYRDGEIIDHYDAGGPRLGWWNFRNTAELLEAASAFVAPYAEMTDAQLRYVADGRNGKGLSINVTPEIATAVLSFRAAIAKAEGV